MEISFYAGENSRSKSFYFERSEYSYIYLSPHTLSELKSEMAANLGTKDFMNIVLAFVFDGVELVTKEQGAKKISDRKFLEIWKKVAALRYKSLPFKNDKYGFQEPDIFSESMIFEGREKIRKDFETFLKSEALKIAKKNKIQEIKKVGNLAKVGIALGEKFNKKILFSKDQIIIDEVSYEIGDSKKVVKFLKDEKCDRAFLEKWLNAYKESKEDDIILEDPELLLSAMLPDNFIVHSKSFIEQKDTDNVLYYQCTKIKEIVKFEKEATLDGVADFLFENKFASKNPLNFWYCYYNDEADKILEGKNLIVSKHITQITESYYIPKMKIKSFVWRINV